MDSRHGFMLPNDPPRRPRATFGQATVVPSTEVSMDPQIAPGFRCTVGACPQFRPGQGYAEASYSSSRSRNSSSSTCSSTSLPGRGGLARRGGRYGRVAEVYSAPLATLEERSQQGQAEARQEVDEKASEAQEAAPPEAEETVEADRTKMEEFLRRQKPLRNRRCRRGKVLL
ncbi:hypothetical protein L596_021887 [Steinernema carpocapsae]|uniref:Uncharacterized protein n=1 Tax=Steinernema carpocapsae TaxID=34508 RepID=A0A4U5MK70_STECR|nr:hypothetical protein L596_021887 [Steinernema carpocapsae]